MNFVDIAVLVILLASAVFSLIRGFIHEVLAIAGWIAAPLAAFWGLPFVKPSVLRFISNETIAGVVAFVAIFVVVLIVCSIITHAISRQVQKSAISSVDRSLGFVFGVARGVFLVSLAFMVMNWLVPTQPDIVASARTLPLMEFGERVIEAVVPEHLAALKDQTKAAAGTLGGAVEAKDAYDRLRAPAPRSDAQNQDKPPTYDDKGLERLIENSNGK